MYPVLAKRVFILYSIWSMFSFWVVWVCCVMTLLNFATRRGRTVAILLPSRSGCCWHSDCARGFVSGFRWRSWYWIVSGSTCVWICSSVNNDRWDHTVTLVKVCSTLLSISGHYNSAVIMVKGKLAQSQKSKSQNEKKSSSSAARNVCAPSPVAPSNTKAVKSKMSTVVPSCCGCYHRRNEGTSVWEMSHQWRVEMCWMFEYHRGNIWPPSLKQQPKHALVLWHLW